MAAYTVHSLPRSTRRLDLAVNEGEGGGGEEDELAASDYLYGLVGLGRSVTRSKFFHHSHSDRRYRISPSMDSEIGHALYFTRCYVGHGTECVAIVERFEGLKRLN